MDILREFPFDKLKVPLGEEVLWAGCNPTFHRSFHYAILLTDKALYLGHVFLILSKRKRMALSDISAITFDDSGRRPSIKVQLRDSSVVFKTPYDAYEDEMAFDREKLKEAVEIVSGRLALL